MEAVLITGASHRAGSAFAKELAGREYFVWIHYHTRREEALATLRSIQEAGGSGEIIAADLAEPTAIDGMLSEISASGNGELSTLINNASLFLPGTLTSSDIDDWNRVMNTNLRSVWYLSKQFVSAFPSAKRIITIGDASVSGGYAEHALYGLSKYALKYLNEQMAEAFAPAIRVNLISPGFMLKADCEPDEQWKQRNERTLTDNSQCLDQVINALCFLMGDPGMDGSELIIDNGLHLNQNHCYNR